MARERSPDSIKAEKMYKDGKSLIDISKAIGKPPGTIRRWKSTQDWDKKSERSESKANARNKSERLRNKKEVIMDEVNQVIENPNLNDKQRLFCLFYVKYRNKTKAYQKAYGASWDNANANAYKLWENMGVRKEIDRLFDEYRDGVDLDIKDLFQWYLDIARADINDFVVITQKGLKMKDGAEIDGILISEVKEGQCGISVKLQDKHKAMQWLGEHIGLANEEQQARIDILKAKTQTEKDLAEINNGILNIADMLQNPVTNRKLEDDKDGD